MERERERERERELWQTNVMHTIPPAALAFEI